MSLSVANIQRALQDAKPEGVIFTNGMLNEEQVKSLKLQWQQLRGFNRLTYRQPYYPPPPLPTWVTMDPLLKLLFIALPVAVLVALITI